MKTGFKVRILVSFIITLGIVFDCRLAAAQTFTDLYNLVEATDGSAPKGDLVLSGDTLYGTTSLGGIQGYGTVFRVGIDGTGFTVLHSFTQADGINPEAGLFLSGDTLYGTTVSGGRQVNFGSVFALSIDGTSYTNLHSFDGTNDGAYSYAGVNVSGSTIYGTTSSGGKSGNGTVFALATDGTGFTVLHSFSATNQSPPYSNSDGANPFSGVTLFSGTLYGTSRAGGNFGNGTVFSVNIDGTGFRNLHSFSGSDGSWPVTTLLLSENTLYGTTAHTNGGVGNGTVFAINGDGTGFRTLHSFAYGEGVWPQALTSLGNSLYSCAYTGGSHGFGTMFKMNTDATGFSVVFNFNVIEGISPSCKLTSLNNVLYGTTLHGGRWNAGTVFSILLPASPPQLAINPAGRSIFLTWPTNATGTLECATNLLSPVWTTNLLPAAVIVNGQNTVTNPITGTQQFFRLSQ